MILVVDSAPIIFLGKINQLPLIQALFEADILVPSVVRNEICSPNVPPDEERLVVSFLACCRVVNLRNPESFATGLSHADNCVLTLARDEKADLLLLDDRLLRRVAILEGVRVVGTIGILLRATKKELLTAEIAENLLWKLVREHNFRISTAVCETARRAFHRIGSNGGCA